MNQILLKTFGGLSKEYYFRQFFFGLLFPALFYFIATSSPEEMKTPYAIIALFTLNTLLYPYSRFVYEKVVGFILGENVFFVNAILMLMVKCFTMSICWTMAIFIAPVGLIYLYFYNSKQQN
ncbi:hypothetical protein [Parashewanella hymeniacidonis]|uniref:hypothetical protein n=1 Tax=Parashewanella hymeniacidonis TaxID=2807618 RepID=UPI001EF6CC96|nr:hypothetical protein [Parashewanella hymeniacidonis]